ncbi:MAG: hypothetical protein K5917_00445 [Clostridiales bacterium]|nr:hypothetical protein [Clostridiales bacterium]
MWISKVLLNNSFQNKAEKANITISNENSVCANGSCEVRNIPVYSPYGIESHPISEADVLLIPCYDGYAICGCKNKASSQINSGELRLFSMGGASIILKNNGDIVLNRLIIKKDGTMVRQED